MGIYYYTFLYKGELVDDYDVPKKYMTKIPSALDNCNIYADNWVILSTSCKILTDAEVRLGMVSLKKILNLVDRDPRLKTKFGQLEDLSDLFVCQCKWDSINARGRTKLQIQHVLPCIDELILR